MSYLTWIVLLGTTLLGAVAGVLGCFAVLRRRALIGDVFSHAALPGLCLAFLILGARHFGGMLAGAFTTGLLAIVLLALLTRRLRTKDDALMGILLSTFFGAGVLLSSVIQRLPGGGAKAGLETYIYGQAAGMVLQDLVAFALVSAGALLFVALLYKELKLLSFDPEFAAAQGWPTTALDILLVAAIAVVTVVGLPAVGVILMAAMLIIPPATARFWTERLGPMLLLAGAIGAVSGILGTLLSAGLIEQWLFRPVASEPSPNTALPAGPLIVLCASAMFLASLLLAPRRGVLARVLLGWQRRWKAATEHLLRDLCEANESRLPNAQPVPPGALRANRAWGAWTIGVLIRYAALRGWVQVTERGLLPTERGIALGCEMLRRHRLWELYLIERAQIAPDHVDRDADSIEHILSPDLVERLETRLASVLGEGASGRIPASPHPVQLPPESET